LILFRADNLLDFCDKSMAPAGMSNSWSFRL
jgi:hypothetical protein